LEVYINTFDVKKFRVAAQTGVAVVNYSYQEETLQINTQTEKATPVDADVVVIEDSEDSKKQKKVLLSNIVSAPTPPGGSDTQFQFNHSGVFGGVAEFTYDSANKLIKIPTKFAIVLDYTSAGINAAIDSLGAGGGEVWLPEGEYIIDSAIIIDQNNTILRGAGYGTFLDASAYSTTDIIELNTKDFIIIRDLRIKGNAGGGNAKDLIAGLGCTDIKLQNLFLEDSDQAGIYLYNTSDRARIENCKITNCDAGAIYTDGDYTVITNNYFDGNKRDMVTLIGAPSYTTIIGNTFRNGTRRGLFLDSHQSTIVGNFFFNNGNGYPDIEINTCINVEIFSNIFASTAGKSEWAISLVGADKVTIIGNNSQGHDTGGILIDANSDNCQVSWNNLEGESGTKISNLGSNNTIINSVAGDTYITGRVGIGTEPNSGLHYQGDILYLTPAAGAESNDNITIKNYATGNGAPDIILRTAD
ncbi:hypothetical protein LCGC14_2578050, partial [marine sediment metagenome]